MNEIIRNRTQLMLQELAEQEVTDYQPQFRNTDEPFQSRLSAFLRGNTEVLEKLAI